MIPTDWWDSTKHWYAAQAGGNVFSAFSAVATFAAAYAALWISGRDQRRVSAEARAKAAIAAGTIVFEVERAYLFATGAQEACRGQCPGGGIMVLKALFAEMGREYPSIDLATLGMLTPLPGEAALLLGKGLAALAALKRDRPAMQAFIGPNFFDGGQDWLDNRLKLLQFAVDSLKMAHRSLLSITRTTTISLP